MIKLNTIYNGDSLEVLKTLEADSVDAICTDPPYGYSFMGKDWDKAVPSVDIWKECLRVLKPGGWCMVMSAPRSDVQNAMISRLMEAGFRLDFTPIYWTYASGFPKAGDVGKLVDKRLGAEREVTGSYEVGGNAGSDNRTGGNIYYADNKKKVLDITAPATDQAKALDGSYTGFQPKPAVEVIIVAMKPLSEKTYVDQALKNGKGVTWLDDCRVPTKEGDTPKGGYGGMAIGIGKPVETQEYTGSQEANPQGRFPANLLVSDSTLTHSESQDYSRYFDLDKWAAAHLSEQQMKTFPFAIFPKASKSEKNKGLDSLEDSVTNDFMNQGEAGSRRWCVDARHPDGGYWQESKPTKNHHPTVKPLKLMSYLITLTTREGDTVLDPFVGSGTTVVAAKQLKRIGIGIEREAEYAEIAQARVDAAEERLRQGVLL